MKHPDKETLYRLLDGELPAGEASGVERHIAACDECAATRAALSESFALLSAATGAVDAAEPEAWRHAVFVPTPAAEATVIPITAARGAAVVRRGPVHWHAGAWRWAAGIVLVTAAAASAAVIAFPELLRTDLRTAAEHSVEVAAPTALAADAAQPAAVVVAALDGAVDIVLTGVSDGTPLHVDYGVAGDVVLAITGATTPRFEARDGRIQADLADAPASVRITLPTGLRSATVTANGIVVVRAADGGISPEEAASGDGMTLRIPAGSR